MIFSLSKLWSSKLWSSQLWTQFKQSRGHGFKSRWSPDFFSPRFSCDVTAAMLVYRTIAKKVFWEFDSIIMQNLSDILPLFCTPTWPFHHVSENQYPIAYIAFITAMIIAYLISNPQFNIWNISYITSQSYDVMKIIIAHGKLTVKFAMLVALNAWIVQAVLMLLRV